MRQSDNFVTMPAQIARSLSAWTPVVNLAVPRIEIALKNDPIDRDLLKHSGPGEAGVTRAQA